MSRKLLYIFILYIKYILDLKHHRQQQSDVFHKAKDYINN